MIQHLYNYHRQAIKQKMKKEYYSHVNNINNIEFRFYEHKENQLRLEANYRGVHHTMYFKYNKWLNEWV